MEYQLPLPPFPIESEYTRCLTALNRGGILTDLPQSGGLGVTGQDGKEYPFPSLNQVLDLFASNRTLLSQKISQGFTRLQLTPLAMPIPVLIDLLTAAILRHAANGTIAQTRHSPTDPLLPVRVNHEKHVWVWETLRQALETPEMVYFPEEYSATHRGLTKLDAITQSKICAVPGWSVGLVENLTCMPLPGQAKTLGGRQQLEIGFSPREYLQRLQTEPFQGETGKTLEDFITHFLSHLETTGEISNDVQDSNALWCLGQYLKIPYAECVPTGRWIRQLGRVRLDMHRTGNKRCAQNFGVSTIVRLSRP